jgi:hypothetical protein
MHRILSSGLVAAAVGSSLAFAGTLSAFAQVAHPHSMLTTDDANLLTFRGAV